MTTQQSTSRSTRVNLSITEERLAWLDEYAASKRWHRSVLIAALIDGFRDRLEPSKSGAEKPPCAEGQHVRTEAKSGSGMIGCKNCGMVKVGPNWVNPA